MSRKNCTSLFLCLFLSLSVFAQDAEQTQSSGDIFSNIVEGNTEFAADQFEGLTVEQQVYYDMSINCRDDGMCKIFTYGIDDKSRWMCETSLDLGVGEVKLNDSETIITPYVNLGLSCSYRTCRNSIYVTRAVFQLISTKLYKLINKELLDPTDQAVINLYQTIMNQRTACP